MKPVSYTHLDVYKRQRIAQGYQDKLYLGNLDSLRDWGYAKDYVELSLIHICSVYSIRQLENKGT